MAEQCSAVQGERRCDGEASTVLRRKRARVTVSWSPILILADLFMWNEAEGV